MDEIICFFKEHSLELRQRKVERFIRFGEKRPQFENITDCYCKRCGKFKSPLSGKFIGV